MQHLESLLTERTRVVSVVHVSNMLGFVTNIAEVARLAHKVGGRRLLWRCAGSLALVRVAGACRLCALCKVNWGWARGRSMALRHCASWTWGHQQPCSQLTVEDHCTQSAVPRLARPAAQVGALVLSDSCQAVPHLPVDVQALGCDWLVASGHKMLGPTASGFLWGRWVAASCVLSRHGMHGSTKLKHALKQPKGRHTFLSLAS